MKRAISGLFLINWLAGATFGQSTEAPPRFEAADVHVSAKTAMAFMRTGPVRGGRYEIKNATMVDLIRTAYGFDSDKILGGPSWLELDRFDVIGKVPAESTPETQKAMLQSLLAERFKLATHKDTRPLPTYALTMGKKHQLKEANGSEESGCKPQSPSGPPAEGGGRLMMGGPGGSAIQLVLGPGMTVQYVCRNMTMEAFAAGLRGFIGSSLGTNAVRDETGLQGKWNFDLKYSMLLIGPSMAETGERISLASAVEKQLGLKLEERPVATPVLVVDSVNRDPGANPPETAEALPALPAPTEFEVASIKAADPGAPMMGGFQMQPGGRLTVRGMPLSFVIQRAFNAMSSDQIVGLPAFAQTDRYEIVAKVPSGSALAAPGPMDMEALAPLLLKLMVDRFNLKYHTEEKPVTAYALVAGKPKMKKADPSSRTSCKNTNAPAGAPPGSRVLSCQNVTMAQFVERLYRLTPDLSWPVADETGLEGSWDVSLTFSYRFPMMAMAVRPPDGGAGQPGNAVPTAADPAGGQTIFEAIEKQLGLKLEKQKRSEKVIVIDHIDQKPTEN